MANAAAQYRRALKKELRCSSSASKRLMGGFNRTLSAYLEEHPSPSADDLIAAFGPPEAMVEVLMAEVTAQEHAIYCKKTLARKILISIAAVILAIFTLYIWFFKNVGLTSTNELTDTPVNWSETYNTVSEDDSK